MCGIPPGMSGSKRPTADDVRRAVADEGIEFLFAQFVDMHAKPSAKLIPAQELEGLLTDGAGFAGFAAGDIGQTPDDPDLIAMPDVGIVHAAAVEAEDRLVRLRRDRRGRGVAVLPAHDPAPPDRALRGRGLRVQDRLRARVLPGPPDRGRRDRDRRPARHARAALLRHPRADPALRLRLRGGPQRQLARLGPVRHRPRGRQRAVRAELGLRRRADHAATARSSTATWSRRWRRSAG